MCNLNNEMKTKDKLKRQNESVTPISSFNLLSEIEKNFDVNEISLRDGTKIWNLLRIYLYFYPLEKANKPKKIFYKELFYILKESIAPIKLPPKNIKICGFSHFSSRKYRGGVFYNRYMDPLYDVLGDNFAVFEWASKERYNRNYSGKIYSTHYVPMHISIFTKAFWKIGFYRMLRIVDLPIRSEDTLKSILNFFSNTYSINSDRLRRDVYNFIALFSYMKDFFIRFLHKISPLAVIIECGYTGLHMALSQACRELNIPSIELQHGLISKYHPGYVKSEDHENRDCVPEYLLTYGDIFTSIVREGNLFDPKKVVTVGFPYIDEVKNSPPLVDEKLNKFTSKFSANILVTSQWTVADMIKKFFIKVSRELKKSDKSIGIIFKPHPRDWRNYSDLENHENIFLVNKGEEIYEILKVIDIHSTAYSTSGLEALALGKPNIFIDVGKTTIEEYFPLVNNKSSFIVKSPKQFVQSLEYILSNYEESSKNAREIGEKFFKPNAKKNIANFLNSIGINIKND